MKQYNSKDVEKKWQKYWEEHSVYCTPDKIEGKENYYVLSEFAYPSGNLHVGHWYAFAVPDIYARYKRMQGYNVLYPIGFDAFGLPAENAAIKRNLDPKDWTYKNMAYMEQQLKSMGASFDWERKIATSDPEYYKWTQWMFTKFYENGIVKQINTKTNWCDSCKTVLANEQVVGGKCERCDTEVLQKDMKQWAFKITDFADALIDDLDELDWDNSIKQAQKEWIGKKEGSEISFDVKLEDKKFNFILMHGWEGTGNGGWFSELHTLFKKNNISFISPDFPDTKNPSYKKWVSFFEKKILSHINENSIILAHSLAPSFLMRYISENDIILNKVIFVAPVLYNKLNKLNNFFEKEFDFFKIKKSIKDIYIIGSDNDPYIDKNDFEELVEKLDTKLLLFNNMGHFSQNEESNKVILNFIGDLISNQKKATYYVIEKSIDVSISQLEQFGKIYEEDDFDDWGKFYRVDVDLEKEENFISFMKEHLLEKNPDGGSWYIDSAGTTNKVILHGKVIDVSTKEGLQEFYDYGKSLGIPEEQLDIKVTLQDKKIKVFTTRADTLFGVTYLVLAPEHPLVQEIKENIENWDEVEAYIEETEKKSELDRQQSREKTGIALKGVSVINPANGEELPVWIADYVLAHFGTGAVMAVPTHDERDADFAIKYNLPFRLVVLPSAGEAGKESELVLHGEIDFIQEAGKGKTGQEKIQAEWNAFYDFLNEVHEAGGILPSGKRICSTHKGRLINSGQFSRMKSDDAILRITDFVGGEMKKTYRLRDWGISRQRYWGTPIPIVYNEKENEKIYKNAHILHFYDKDTWSRLINGYKTVETRALNPEEKDRYFGDFKAGEYLRAINKKTGDERYLKIKKIWKFKNLEKLLDSPEIIEKIYAPKKPAQTIEELIKGYSFTDSYINKINEDGLIAWEIELINPGVRIVPEEYLPWLLPEDVDHTPDGTAPLARSKELKERTERIFGKGWTPEVDTMDTFVDSSWYFYRYLDAQNQERFASEENIENWMPIAMYFGGAEHTTMHLLYSRFWVKALHKLGLVPHKEPYAGRLNRGLILGPDGVKMSKSKGNVVDPDEVVAHVGADVVRMYLAFIGPFNEPGNYPWSPNGVVGMRRFIERIYGLSDKIEEISSENLMRALHKTIKKVTEDIERLKLNTAISAMMIWVKLAEKEKLGREEYRKFLKLFAIFAPHMAEEIWQENLGEEKSIHLSDWPLYEEKYVQEDCSTLPIQVNGKVRAQLSIAVDTGEEEVQRQALALLEIQKWVGGKEVKKFIYVKEKIVNIVI